MSFTSFLSDRSSSKLPPPQPDNPSAFLQTASFSNPQSTSQSSSSSPPSDSFSAESLFGGASTYDPAQLHPLAGLGSGKQLEYLTLEDDKTNLEGGAMMGNRGFMDDVQTGTGTAYVTGLGLGGVMGSWKALRDPTKMSGKLRWNAVLNNSGARGTYLANSAGTLAIFYNSFNNIIPMVRPDGLQDVWTSMGAAALSGLLWNISSSPRVMLVGATTMAGGAAGWNYVKTLL
ncbi:hypothetical protein BDY24DRAFT_396683 [Mrakia frigida]|uniref:protein transporter TIM23 n=1 Tax=Mrakia frigida TaxID=29902 RepID=UPI003FCC1402